MEANKKPKIKLLPDVIDNQYHGMKIAKYAFAYAAVMAVLIYLGVLLGL